MVQEYDSDGSEDPDDVRATIDMERAACLDEPRDYELMGLVVLDEVANEVSDSIPFRVESWTGSDIYLLT